MEASEEKRNAYQKAIKNIQPQSLIYIDESGIELTICKDRGCGKKSEQLVGKKVVNITNHRVRVEIFRSKASSQMAKGNNYIG